jgi:transcriptional regulator with XRE-family HTH domain
VVVAKNVGDAPNWVFMEAIPNENRVDPDAVRSSSSGRIPADTFSNRLLLARKLAGMTIEQAAEATGLKSSSWSNWEKGMRPQGQVDVCVAIAAALDVDFNWLLLGGQLAGARGKPTKRVVRDTSRYDASTERMTPVRSRGTRPNVRVQTAAIDPRTRRPVRIGIPAAA